MNVIQFQSQVEAIIEPVHQNQSNLNRFAIIPLNNFFSRGSRVVFFMLLTLWMSVGEMPFLNSSWLSLGLSDVEAAITFRAKSTAQAKTTSLAGTMPTGTVEGDIMIATMVLDVGGETLGRSV